MRKIALFSIMARRQAARVRQYHRYISLYDYLVVVLLFYHYHKLQIIIYHDMISVLPVRAIRLQIFIGNNNIIL